MNWLVICVDLKTCLNEGLVECSWISASSNNSRSASMTADDVDPAPRWLTYKKDKEGDTPTFYGQRVDYTREIRRRVL